MVDATNDAGPTPAEGSKAPFPYGKLAMISSVCFASAISFSGLFPYAGFMVADLMHISPNESGYYAGYLSAAMMLGRVFSSVPWGMYADKHGRKPTLLIGLLTIVITSITFGLSQNMALALCSRFLLGLFNPIIAIGKTLVSEVTTKEQEAQGMATLTGTWGVGLVFGPALGGLLSRPVLSYPGFFRAGAVGHPLASLLTRYPYLLPNLCTALYAAVELGVIYLYFEETLPSAQGQGQGQGQAEAVSSEHGDVQDASASDGDGDGDGDGDVELGAMRAARVGGEGRLGRLAATLLRQGGGTYAKLTQDEEGAVGAGGAEGAEQEGGITCSSSCPVLSATVTGAGESASASNGKSAKEQGPYYLLSTFPTVRRALAAYFFLSMVSITFDEVMPLWALSSFAKGGLEYSNVDIGEILSYTGGGLIVYTMLLFPRISDAIGPMRCFRFGLRVAAPLMVLCTLLPGVVRSPRALYAVLVVNVLFVKLSTTTAFTANALLINNSVPAPSYRASVNGLAMSLGSCAKTLGPCVGATLYAWSIDGSAEGGGDSSAINFHFVFVLLALMSLASSLVYSGDLTTGPASVAGLDAATVPVKVKAPPGLVAEVASPMHAEEGEED